MDRRSFIRLAGGGAIAAAAAAPIAGCSISSAYPAAAVEAWKGPGAETDARKRAVAYAITAPNPHNLQPWLVDLREPNVITLYTDRERVLPHTDPFGRQILIGHGAFLELLVIALAEQGLAADVALWPQGELAANLKEWDRKPIARIAVKPGAARDPLFAHILNRHTPKSDFDTTRPVAADTLRTLTAGSGRDGIKAAGTVDAAALAPLRELCWQSARVELLTPRTVMESVHLTRVGPGEILKHRDGITLNSPFLRAVDAVGMFDRKNPPAEGSEAYKTMMSRFEGHSRTAMGFVWLTGRNRRADQVNAGRAYVRLQLQATALGVGMHPMSQALQEFAEMVPHYERAHQLMLGRPAPKTADDETVQMFCRLGYTATPAPATPRRPLAAFVV
jgi:hypothetical protein